MEVYRDGALIARKTVRVNDPLEVNGFVVHQNSFGPAADGALRGPQGDLLWTGPVVLAGTLFGRPQGVLSVPGTQLSLLMVLDRSAAGGARLVVEGDRPSLTAGTNDIAFVIPLTSGETTDPRETTGYSLTFRGIDAWSGLSVKRDPGTDIIWVAFVALVSGLSLTFYFPRRRIWLRSTGTALQVALLAERYVESARELDEVVAGFTAACLDDGMARPVGS